MQTTRQPWRSGERRRELLLRQARAPIDAAGVTLEYLSLADPDTLQELQPTAATARALVSLAARVDGVRLIDNLLLPDDLGEPPPMRAPGTARMAGNGAAGARPGAAQPVAG